MNAFRISRRIQCGLLLGALTVCSGVGCQSTVGGQTLPSPDYLKDDVQFFPAGQEYILPQQKQALDEYRLQRETDADPFTGP